MDLFACAVKVGVATESRLVPRRSALWAGSFVDRGQIVDVFVGAVEVGSATNSRLVPRRSALGAGSFVDRGWIVAFASRLVGTATDSGGWIVNKGGGLHSAGTVSGVYRFAELPLVSLCRCRLAGFDVVVFAVEPDLLGPGGGGACVGPTGTVVGDSHPRVLSASVRGGWQMCTLVWGGLEVGDFDWDGSGGAFATGDLHSDSQWFAWGRW